MGVPGGGDNRVEAAGGRCCIDVGASVRTAVMCLIIKSGMVNSGIMNHIIRYLLVGDAQFGISQSCAMCIGCRAVASVFKYAVVQPRWPQISFAGW